MPAKAEARPKLTKQQRDARLVAELLADMDDGSLPPWRMPWAKNMFRQANAISKRPYRGINMFLTARKADVANYADHRWLTFKQAQASGGHIRKGEKGCRIVFWKFPQDDSVPPCVAPTPPSATPRTIVPASSRASSCGNTRCSTPTRRRALTCPNLRN